MVKIDNESSRDVCDRTVDIACHNCDCICPQDAMRMHSYFRVDEGRFATALRAPDSYEGGLPNPLDLPTPEPFSEIESKLTDVEKVIYKRRSVRSFKPDPVPKEIVNRILESARFSPTAGNCQDFKYTVITDRKLMDELSECTLGFLGKFANLWKKDTPFFRVLKRLLCLIYPNATDPRPMQAVYNAVHKSAVGKQLNVFFDAPCAIMITPGELHISDPELGAGIACQNMVLTAHALGLGTCYVGLAVNAVNKDKKTRKKFEKILGLEYPFDKPAMFVLLGYPAAQIDGIVSRDFPPVTWIEPKD